MDEVVRVREKTDIVSLISEFVPLRKAGRNFKVPCPFHNEKTPSFVVSPERQIWHCFGCGKGGDVFTFLMEYEKLEFVEALRTLAKKAGIELSQSDLARKGASQKERIYKINDFSSEFYHFILTKHPSGKRAMEYLTQKRKIDPRLIKTFKIGYAPFSGSPLTNYLIQKKKLKSQELLEAGISTPRNGRLSDFFRNRIMFPIYDHRDNIVAFSGRVLSDDIKESKYINTRDTLVYHKGGMFFGLNMAKNEIKKKDQAIIMEGEFDVISSFSEGIENTVAIKGTALTEDQVALLARFTDKVTLCLDKDEAGFEAIKRSLGALERKGMTTTIVELGEYKDPDEAIKKDALFFKKQLKNDIGVYDYLISSFLEKFDKNEAMGKKKIGDNLLPFIALIDNEIVKEHYLKKLAGELDTSFENLMTELDKSSKKEAVGTQFIPQMRQRRSRKETIEEYLLSLIIQFEDWKKTLKEISEILKDYKFELPAYQKIFDALNTFSSDEKIIKIGDIIKALPQEIVPIFDRCYLLPLPKFEDNDKYLGEILKAANEAKMVFIKNKIKEMSFDLSKREKGGEQMDSLQKELILLSQTINQLSSASKN